MTKTTATTALVVMIPLVLSGIGFAHEGPHKVMGTVSAVHEHRVDVKTTDGKNVSITTEEKTKILRGATAIRVTDIRVGDRVVVTATEKKDSAGKLALTASEVRLGAPAARATKSPGRRDDR
ncbi:MAG TPA: hypothetical protein VF921_12630 [Vicinamibacterales bacterium]